ncbi:hypothetical protein [Leptospira sp. GIMC2001]|uniref:hypothetical protein n=1 Tax=Leptospira sp. GIMC2001 TaxID=1513297 RepID=UPI00234AE577|nr:hypothetical protein [Leptospira sp. GIMC2001]WCL48454.1 hypothetical protein O4O04_14230 [Leptospira sp. GIMC2001]
MQVKLEEKTLNYKMDGGLRNTFLIMIVIGIISLAYAFIGFGHENSRHLDATGHAHHTNMGYSVLLVATYLIFGLSAIALFFTAIQHITGAMWSVTLRRLLETIGTFIPFLILPLAGVMLGMHDLYEWTHEGIVDTDELIKHKSGYLNENFFRFRLVFYVVVWSIFAYLFYSKSTAQDTDKDVDKTKFMAKLSGGTIVFFALSFCLAAIDLIMSLTPHWFSTMFGVYNFAAALQTGLAVWVIITALLKKKGFYGDSFNENHLHDIGKFMLGMTVFWAYVAFSQLMLIIYANIPEETFFYEQRWTGGWASISLLVPAIKFVVPFFLLLNRPNKRSFSTLVKISVIILFSQILEIYWLVFPANFENFAVIGFILSLGASIGALGFMGFYVFKKLETNKLIPVGDPRLDNCLNHHQ